MPEPGIVSFAGFRIAFTVMLHVLLVRCFGVAAFEAMFSLQRGI